jgi:hypothetical protein
MSLKDKAAQVKKTVQDAPAVDESGAAYEAPAVEETPKQEVAVHETAAAPAVAPPKVSAFITAPALLEVCSDAPWGTFLSVTSNNGTHQAGEEDLGKTIKFQAIVSKEIMKVIPGSQDEEAKEYFQVSDDGEFVRDGRTLDEALADAKEAGYDRAAIKTYIDVVALVVESINEEFVGEIITLQLAPSSIFSWRPLEGKCKAKAALGMLKAQPVLDNPDLGSAVVFTSVATPAKFSGKSYTKFVFSI